MQRESQMQRRLLGKTGYEVSEIGLGCWQLGGDFGAVGDETARQILEHGARARRQLLGHRRRLWRRPARAGSAPSRTRRACSSPPSSGAAAQFPGMTGYTRRNVKESLAGSLKRLGGETLDLAQLHCIPTEVLRDGEIFTIMDDLRDEGMMRALGRQRRDHRGGAAVPAARGLRDAADHLQPVPPGCVDPAAARRRRASNVGIIVRLPLASGLLSGKFTKDTTFAAQRPPQLQPRRQVVQRGRDLLRPAVREGRGAGRRAQAAWCPRACR